MSRAGSPKKGGRALLFQTQQGALHRAHAGGRDVAVAPAELRAVLAHIRQHLAKILQVEQKQAGFVRNAEGQAHKPALHFIKSEQTRQQQRTHFACRGAQGVPARGKHIPEADRKAPVRVPSFGKMQGGDALRHLAGREAGHGNPGQIALDIRHKDGRSQGAEALGQSLQGDGFAAPRRAGDETVTIGHVRQKRHILLPCVGDKQPALSVKHRILPRGFASRNGEIVTQDAARAQQEGVRPRLTTARPAA